MPQPLLKPIDCFARGHALDLGTNEPTIHVKIGLRDHGLVHGRIAMFG